MGIEVNSHEIAPIRTCRSCVFMLFLWQYFSLYSHFLESKWFKLFYWMAFDVSFINEPYIIIIMNINCRFSHSIQFELHSTDVHCNCDFSSLGSVCVCFIFLVLLICSLRIFFFRFVVHSLFINLCSFETQFRRGTYP